MAISATAININDELCVMTGVKFNELLEQRVAEDDITYIDAIVDICQKEGLELESVPRLLNNRTRRIIRNEADNLNMLKREEGGRLPV